MHEEAVHDDAPAVELKPVGHTSQLACASDAAKVPAVHSWQLLWPALLAKVPALQAWQVDEPVTLVNLPGAHGVQADCPDVSVYVPTGQTEQFPFASWNWPGWQLPPPAVQADAPADDVKPGAHAAHTVDA